MKDAEILYLLVAEDFCRLIERELEGEAYVVGGAVRDIMSNRRVKDIDITTSADIKELGDREDLVIKDFHGGEWGSLWVYYRDYQFDVTRMRGEEVYEEGRLVEVAECADIETDSQRRDFTVDAGYLRVDDDSKIVVTDPTDLFWEALREKTIRFVGTPADRIREDPLRILRAYRIAAQMGWSIDPTHRGVIREMSDCVSQCSGERVRAELDGILMSNPDRIPPAFLNMHFDGVLKHILPELSFAMEVDQNKHHKEYVGAHLILAASHIRKNNLLLRWAALLHDIAKPKVKKWNPRKKDWTFYNHEVQSAFDAKAIMRRLTFSNKEIDYVFRIIQNHMYYITKATKIPAVRRRIHRVGGSHIFRDILRLRIADRNANLAKTGSVTPYLRKLIKMVRRIDKEDSVLKVTDLKVGGKEMITLGLKRRQIGECLEYLLSRCISAPSNNRRSWLIKEAKKWMKKNGVTTQR